MLRTGGLPGTSTPRAIYIPTGRTHTEARQVWVQAVLSEGAQQTQGSAACEVCPVLLTSTLLSIRHFWQSVLYHQTPVTVLL